MSAKRWRVEHDQANAALNELVSGYGKRERREIMVLVGRIATAQRQMVIEAVRHQLEEAERTMVVHLGNGDG